MEEGKESAVNKAAEVLGQVDTAVEEIRQRNEDIAASISQQNGLNRMIQSKVEVVSQSAEQNKQQSYDLAQQNTRLEGVRLKLESQLKRINS